MKYVKHYRQQTVKTDDPKEFDDLINEIFIRAAGSGKEPEVHFFEGMGLCASVRYFVNLTIPESLSEEHEARGEFHKCYECPFFEVVPGKKKKGTCPKGSTWIDSNVCDIYYERGIEDGDQSRAIEE